MRKYTQEELNNILKLHKMWLNGDSNGVRANFSDTDCSGVNFYETDLTRANFSGANLTRANFSGANLYKVNFDEILLLINHPIYTIQIKGKKWIRVGCQEHSYKEWLSFTNEDINDMANDALEFYPILVKYLKATFK
jgi:hypothetical protein